MLWLRPCTVRGHQGEQVFKEKRPGLGCHSLQMPTCRMWQKLSHTQPQRTGYQYFVCRILFSLLLSLVTKFILVINKEDYQQRICPGKTSNGNEDTLQLTSLSFKIILEGKSFKNYEY